MNAFKKTIVAASIAAATIFSGTAAAAPFNSFTVDPINGNQANFVADKITGNYTETATFNPDGTFNVALVWTAGQFVGNGGNTAYEAFQTGLGANYGLFANYSASGTYAVSGSTTTFTFQPGTGSLNLFLDTTLGAAGGDVLLGSGSPIAGQGTLDPMLSTCANPGNPGGNGINCGDFGASNSFMLTDAGKSFFILPNPFYSLSFQSGHLNNFTPAGTQTINGSLDVVFSGEPTDVPEPASVGLLGLGLLGLYAARRRSKKAA
jgi:hypothetical protein